VLQDASRTSERLTRVYNDAVQQRQGKIDDGRFLQVLERDVLPPWRAQRQRLAQVQGLPREEQRLVEECGTFFQMREESWELVGRAVRHSDPRSAEQSEQKALESEQFARQFAADAGRLLDQVKKELDQDFNWMAGLDRQAFLVHYEMARQVGEEARREMEERYRFHLAVQEIHGRLSAHNKQVQATLRQIAGKRELTQDEFRVTLDVLGQAHDALGQALDAAAQLRLPPLKNVTPGEPLGPLLLSRPLAARLSGASNRLDGQWIGRFLEQVGEVLDKGQRIHFKSLGGILALQERVAERWAAMRAAP